MSESEPQIKYPLHGRDVETRDGDIRARHDFSSEEYPELYEAIREPYLIQSSIRDYFEAKQLRALSRRGASDPEIKKRFGTLKACKLEAHNTMQRARVFYLESQGLPTATAPVDDSDAAHDQFYEATQAWATFRETILEDPDELAALEASVQSKISKFTNPYATIAQ